MMKESAKAVENGTLDEACIDRCAERVKTLTLRGKAAVENAKRNAAYNNVQNADFICAGAEAVADVLAKSNKSPDVIILDPPRKGCDSATIEAVLGGQPKKIVMISCNPSTAARDCAAFEMNGYKVECVRGVDMFPRTGHVECVVLLTRND